MIIKTFFKKVNLLFLKPFFQKNKIGQINLQIWCTIYDLHKFKFKLIRYYFYVFYH